MNDITILVVDDHRLVRDCWSAILNSDPRFIVIGETSNVDEAVEIARNENPHIVLMDINMKPVDGFDATKKIRHSSPCTKVIGLSMYNIPIYAKKMMKEGAMGYVTKNSSKEEMIEAIIEVNNGKKYICKEIKNILVHQELEDDQQPGMDALSAREWDIVKQIKKGLTSKEIAFEFDLSLKTVEVHRYNILKKLKLNNTASLVNLINTQWL